MRSLSRILAGLVALAAVVLAPATPVQAKDGMNPVANYEFAGGTCVLKWTREPGTNSEYFQVVHRNGGRVEMNVRMWTDYQAASWQLNDGSGSIYRGYSWALKLDVHAYCMKGGEWKVAPVVNVR